VRLAVSAIAKMARSERFELPTLGIEIFYAMNKINELAAPCCIGVANTDLAIASALA
jgi:hypothetical protein